MTISSIGTLLCYMVVSSFTPGPGNLLALNTTTNFGWKKGKILVCGICFGYACVQFLCTIAIYALNTWINPALAVLKYIGGAYVFWLAVHIMRSKPEESENKARPTFRTGFLLQLVNAKIYFYITTLLTTYLVPYFVTLPKLLIAGVGVVAIGCIATFTWAFCGMKMQTFYKQRYRQINIILGLFLLYCAWNMIRS